jgi:hypothetical protein
MLLVYSHKITPRLKYAFRHICTRILGIPVQFTSKIEDFIAHDSLKISYTKQALSNELFVKSSELLFEQGLSDLDVQVQTWEDTKCFFSTGAQGVLPFDIFAATFYLLSRYEEYLPHVKDVYGRFTAKESLAYKHDFLQQPVIDIWAYKFQKILQANFSDYNYPKRAYNIKTVIDVPTAFYYKHKGLLRTIGGTLKDIFKFKKLYERYLVLLKLRRDPYDTFRWIINKQKQANHPFFVFFLIGDYSTYDKNVNVNRRAFVSLIKSVADYCKVGLKVSYLALDNFETLKNEKSKMENVINTHLEVSRNSFSKINLPTTYRNLLELEIQEDFSMGYVNEIGFRAGTCTPFLFYDLDYEVQTPLLVNTFHIMDFSLLKIKSFLDKKETLLRLIASVKQVNGTFVPVFHNYSFSDEERWRDFKELFNIIIASEHE